MKKKLSELIHYNEQGLVPVVVQEYQSGIVLMMAYADKTALDYTETTGKATYFSRSRNKLWCKGEESGNYQEIKEIRIDCDNDTVLYIVEQKGVGAACHTGHKSCFYRTFDQGNLFETDQVLYFDPQSVYNKK